MEIKNIFSIPLGISVNEDYKKTQKNLIKHCNKIKSKNKTGGKYWEAKLYNTFSTHPVHSDEKFKDINNFIFSEVTDFSKKIGHGHFGVACAESWFNIYDKYDYQENHDHVGYDISAVYFLQGSDKTGTLNFKNPAPSKRSNLFNPENQYTFSTMCIKPQPGLLVIFNSNLMHSVSQNLSNEKRISLAYNFKLLNRKEYENFF
tara:strand:- start:463 stop:1071 length:609 start_codon:yes stop_codon:yes gene_type:complete